MCIRDSVTALSEKGTPTPLAHTLLRAPISRMDILSPLEISGLVAQSRLSPKYNAVLDRESAFELLEKRMKAEVEEEQEEKADKPKKPAKPEPSMIEDISKNTMVRQVGRTVVRELTRGLLGVLGIKSRR